MGPVLISDPAIFKPKSRGETRRKKLRIPEMAE
jgi:ribosomal protein S6E (S10)